ncbi:MAG TPA: DNA gyrase inhibitor YacG [Terriglobia bacterium]
MRGSSFRCPICRRNVKRSDPNFPFCSDRCRGIDLGRWASESYRVATPFAGSDLAVRRATEGAQESEGE